MSRKKKKKAQGIVLNLEKTQPVVVVKVEMRDKGLSVVTDEDIKALPLSVRINLDAVTALRKRFNLPDDVRAREEGAVKRFRGH